MIAVARGGVKSGQIGDRLDLSRRKFYAVSLMEEFGARSRTVKHACISGRRPPPPLESEARYYKRANVAIASELTGVLIIIVVAIGDAISGFGRWHNGLFLVGVVFLVSGLAYRHHLDRLRAAQWRSQVETKHPDPGP